MTTEPEDDHTVAGCGTKGTSMVDEPTQADHDFLKAIAETLWPYVEDEKALPVIARHRLASTEALRAQLAATSGREEALRLLMAEREAEIARAKEALEHYADLFCEGWCAGKDPVACAAIGDDNCSGCHAVVALAKLSEGRS